MDLRFTIHAPSNYHLPSLTVNFLPHLNMLLSVANLKKAYGPDEILTGVSFRMSARERVALVGRNGTGKTTLLKIITGRLEPDSGSVQLAQGAKVGYLRQEAPVTAGLTVLEEAEQAVAHRLALKARMEELELLIADRGSRTSDQGENNDAYDQDLEEYALLHEHFLEAEGYWPSTISGSCSKRWDLQRMSSRSPLPVSAGVSGHGLLLPAFCSRNRIF